MVLVEIRPKAWHAGMPLSWNEIRHRAIAFSKEWKGETREAAERQTFWNEFFKFGIHAPNSAKARVSRQKHFYPC